MYCCESHVDHAYWNGTSWNYEEIDSCGGTSCYGYRSSVIRLDSEGHAHIAYNTNQGIMGASIAYSRWDGEKRVKSYRRASFTNGLDFALDSNNTAHLCYPGQGWGEIEYYIWNTGHSERFDYAVNSQASVQIDSQDRLHAAYSNGGNLRYAEYDGGWRKETVDTGSYPSIAVDSRLNHIAYYYNNTIKYARGVYRLSNITLDCTSSGDELKIECKWSPVDAENYSLVFNSENVTTSLSNYTLNSSWINCNTSYNLSVNAYNKFGDVIGNSSIVNLTTCPCLPDLSVNSSDLTSNSTPVEGQVMGINATIHNLGYGNASSVLVEFLLDGASIANQRF